MKSDMQKIATYDKFDIVEAWYIWLCTHHCGIVAPSGDRQDGRQNSLWWQSYNRLSWLEDRLKFRPRPNLTYETLTENGKEIHQDICRRLGTCDCLKEQRSLDG